MIMEHKLVVIRHGESEWNRQNRFTGWVDVDLSSRGEKEVAEAAKLLCTKGYSFDLAFTSLQKRAIKTLWLVLDQLQLHWIEVIRDWRLNERHYGALQGLNKAEVMAQYGAEQVKTWRRSYDTSPPLVDQQSEHHPVHDLRYARLGFAEMPAGESLSQVVTRVEPCWQEHIWPQIKGGRKVLISAHGNSLRALVVLLTGMSGEDVLEFNIPTAEPVLLRLNDAGMADSMEFINDIKTIQARQKEVANQAERGCKSGRRR